MGKYISIRTMYTGVCMRSNGTSINTGRRCGVEVFRYVEDNETVVPKKSKYLFKFLLASVDANEMRYQHNWAVKATLNNNVIHNTTVAFPKSASLNNRGYLSMKKGQFYEVFSVEKDLDNNGSNYNLTMFGNCNSTVPKNCTASLSFSTPVSMTAPQIAALNWTVDGADKLVHIICTCAEHTSAPTKFKFEVYRYENNSTRYDTPVASYEYAANSNSPYIRSVSAAALQDLRKVLPGDAVYIKVTAYNDAGAASRPCGIIVRGGAAVCKYGGVFKNATPYVKHEGTWVPAKSYGVDNEGDWALTKQGVELNYELPK